MIKTVIYIEPIDETVELGSFPPSKVEDVVSLIKQHGAFASDTGSSYQYHQASYDLAQNRFEIVVS